MILDKLAGGDRKVDGAVRGVLRAWSRGPAVVVSVRAAERLGVEVGRGPAAPLKAGRSVSNTLIVFLPPLLAAVAVPVCFGLLIGSLFLAGVLD